MDVEILKKTKNELEFKILGDKYTVTGFLQSKLLENPNVEEASYLITHPDTDEVIFHIKTKKQDAKDALDLAMKVCKKEMADFNKNVLSLISKAKNKK